MIIFAVSGAWTVQRAPRLLEDYPHPAIETCNDVSGAYPPIVPNIGVWECTANATTLALIESNTAYAVFWSEEIIDGTP